jgi:hypothetical protein
MPGRLEPTIRDKKIKKLRSDDHSTVGGGLAARTSKPVNAKKSYDETEMRSRDPIRLNENI